MIGLFPSTRVHLKVRSFWEHSCTILSSFKIVIIFNICITSAEIKTQSDDVNITENDHNFERTENQATVFLKWMDCIKTWILSFLKFGLSEKHSRFEKIFLMVLTNQLIYLVNVKTTRKIFSNYVCFSKSPNFESKIPNHDHRISLFCLTTLK